MLQFFPNCLIDDHSPIDAPNESISGFLCPIINILLLSNINSLKACAITLALTLVLFSNSRVFPPKKVIFSLFLITA